MILKVTDSFAEFKSYVTFFKLQMCCSYVSCYFHKLFQDNE